MKIEHATAQKPSRTKNDDIVGWYQNTFWLMDGATQLVPPAHGLDASWFTNTLSQSFRAALEIQPSLSLEALARQGIRDTAQQFFAGSGVAPDAAQELRPFCTLVLCRISEDFKSLAYILVADSTLAVMGEGSEQAVSDQRIDDDKPLAAFYDILAQGHGYDSELAKTAMRDVYLKGAARINRPGGWYSVAQDESVIDHAVRGVLMLPEKADILLMSDGFTRATEMLALYPSFSALNQDVNRIGLLGVIDAIRLKELSDPQGISCPRPWIHDDATALRIRLVSG